MISKWFDSLVVNDREPSYRSAVLVSVLLCALRYIPQVRYWYVPTFCLFRREQCHSQWVISAFGEDSMPRDAWISIMSNCSNGMWSNIPGSCIHFYGDKCYLQYFSLLYLSSISGHNLHSHFNKADCHQWRTRWKQGKKWWDLIVKVHSDE